jgi:dTDP-4-dehydrorhamnose 3,5-epimerase
MKVEELNLQGVYLITPKIFFDSRGFFYESFKQSFMKEHGIESTFVQDNHSFSKKGVLRGMHFQPGQSKILNLISGKIFDVFVDLRKESSTYGSWGSVVLDSAHRTLLLIPDGFAHGFYTLSDEAHLIYKVSDEYRPELEKSFRYDDPSIGICWPEGEKTLSEKDLIAPYFAEVMS